MTESSTQGPVASTEHVLDPTGVSGRAKRASSDGEEPLVRGESAQDAIEYYYRKGWTDGLPVVPCTEQSLEQFLARTDRDPDEVLLEMPHLNRKLTVRRAAINAVLAGCLPEYFPVVLAAWESLRALGIGHSALWQSTTGTAPFLLINGPVAERLEINSAGNIFGSGFRANATIGRAIRLTALNTFALKPHLLDQATHGSPAKYTCCIAEREEQSPWPSFHTDQGFTREESTATAMFVRGSLYMEARHTTVPEQLLHDFAESASRTGRMIGSSGTVCVVFSPEHAGVLAGAGWSKSDVQQFLYDNSVRSTEDLDRVGKGAVSKRTRWRLPVDHPDATEPEGGRGPVHTLASPSAIQIAVAGADNAGVSTILDTMMSSNNPPAITKIAEVSAD